MRSKHKEPSLLRQLIGIHYEQAQRRKALRQLAKAKWSFEFLTEVVRQASLLSKQDIEIEVRSSDNRTLIIRNVSQMTNLTADDDIFNKLDDDTAIEQFIAKHTPRR